MKAQAPYSGPLNHALAENGTGPLSRASTREREGPRREATGRVRVFVKTALSQRRARELRQQSTDAEKKLWQHLRNRQLDGIKFRRQAPIGPYIADFAAVEALLIVELDAGQHSMRTNSDEKRTAWLKGHGYRVVRFWNNDVLANPEGVVEVIQRFLRDGGRPSPTHCFAMGPPSPASKRGRGT
jgi:very-short-patch-repair endonuclease